MKDAYDAMAEAGADGGPLVLEQLSHPQALARDAARLRAARRRRGVSLGIASAVVATAAAGAWAAWPTQPDATDVATARVADLPVFDARADRSSCAPSTTPQAYVPWAADGVTVASEEVRGSGIAVATTALVTDDADRGTLRRVEPLTAVDVPGSPAEGGSLIIDCDVTWTGDALYTVDAAAFLVVSGRVVSPVVGWYGDAEDREVSGGGSTVPLYDADANTSSISVVSPVQPTCLAALPTSTWACGAPAEPAQLHTVVQVQDESGAPLATFVDGAGLDGTTVAFPGFLAGGALGVSLTQPTPSDVEAGRAAREQGVGAEPSAAAVMRDAVAARGVPLAQAGAGIGLSGRCDVLESRASREGLDLPVVPIADDRLSGFPDALPPETIRGSRSVDLTGNPGENPLRGTSTLLLLNPQSGAVEASLPLRFFTQAGGASTTVLAGSTTSCTDRDIAPGDYQALVVDPDDRSDEALALADAFQPVTARWYDLGVVTVLPGACCGGGPQPCAVLSRSCVDERGTRDRR